MLSLANIYFLFLSWYGLFFLEFSILVGSLLLIFFPDLFHFLLTLQVLFSVAGTGIWYALFTIYFFLCIIMLCV